MRVAIVGSGVSGVFTAHALSQRGVEVTILDVGETLDPDRSAAVARLRQIESADWPKEDHDRVRPNSVAREGELPKKVHFGSDYIYAQDRPFARLTSTAAGRASYPTFAKGGFSNIWGAAVLPTDHCDMEDWPVSRAELDPYFRKVAALLPLCGGEGTLSEAFPSYADRLGNLDVGPQGEALLADLGRRRSRASHMLYGKARLAVHFDYSLDALPCTGCGHCFTGCARGAIFSAVPMLEALLRTGAVAYRSGLFVEAVGENARSVSVTAIDVKSLERHILEFDAVFVAAGPINSTRLLLNSKGLFDLDVRLKESQKFLLPAVRMRGAETGITHPAVTLASVFLETKIPALSNHWFHTQMIPMNAMIAGGAGLPGLDHIIGRRLWSPVLRHTMMAWCGMHSDHSSELVLRLRRGAQKGADVLKLDSRIHESARVAARRAVARLFREGLRFGTIFCSSMLRFANPGSGTHCGSSFPMRRSPTKLFDSDSHGRPFGWSRIFVVDSSVLPSIPGTTLAFPVMANAYRIASQAILSS